MVVLETPSDIRGTGMVGELSARITDAFSQAKAKVRKDYGLLVITEADDLALSRAELQAHHEDRAGLNVLIKQLDLLQREEHRLGGVMITNRIGALDPAVRRRAALVLEFSRPGATERRAIFEQLPNWSACHTSWLPVRAQGASLARTLPQRRRLPPGHKNFFGQTLEPSVKRLSRTGTCRHRWFRDSPSTAYAGTASSEDLKPTRWLPSWSTPYSRALSWTVRPSRVPQGH
ncbi:AAA family ATPase [Hyalangium gracile]|uniref:AAA family ATPase n=1 Tax=Hyalangium gracile TaxID=394092 RepID=UPI003898ED6D